MSKKPANTQPPEQSRLLPMSHQDLEELVRKIVEQTIEQTEKRRAERIRQGIGAAKAKGKRVGGEANRKATPEKITLMVQLSGEGWSVRKIAKDKRIRMSYAQVSKILRQQRAKAAETPSSPHPINTPTKGLPPSEG